jgi:hypothetical protein
MTNLFQLFDEATTTAPPSRLSVDDVFAAMQSRRRRRLRNTVAGVAAIATAVVSGIVWTANLTGPGPDVSAAAGPVIWAGRGDADHLYLVRNTCGDDQTSTVSALPSAEAGPPERGCSELLASSDGGASWLSRGSTTYPPTVLGARTLMRFTGYLATEDPTLDARRAMELSTDGGATWSPMPREGPPIDAVPPGGALADGFTRELTVFDPAQGRLRPLAHRPVLLRELGMPAVIGPGGIWVTGLNRQTGRPSVAVSHDGGATWIERELPVTAVLPQPTMFNGEIDPNASRGLGLQVIARDGLTAYATILIPGTMGSLHTFRTTDGGLSWQAVADRPTTPSYIYAWMASGGRIVASLPARKDDEPIQRYVTSTDGADYAPAAPPGLPALLEAIDGSIAYSDSAVYVSDDGWSWREVWRG